MEAEGEDTKVVNVEEVKMLARARKLSTRLFVRIASCLMMSGIKSRGIKS
jgi:hypothetical protein